MSHFSKIDHSLPPLSSRVRYPESRFSSPQGRHPNCYRLRGGSTASAPLSTFQKPRYGLNFCSSSPFTGAPLDVSGLKREILDAHVRNEVLPMSVAPHTRVRRVGSRDGRNKQSPHATTGERWMMRHDSRGATDSALLRGIVALGQNDRGRETSAEILIEP